jgi:hypothetical protein
MIAEQSAAERKQCAAPPRSQEPEEADANETFR